MKVILTSDVVGLGSKNDIKEVSSGFAINYLIPRGLVKQATAGALSELELAKKRHDEETRIKMDLLTKSLASLKGKAVKLEEKANEKGHLFAQIHKEEISNKIKSSTGIDIPAQAIKMEAPIKEVGDHEITIEISGKEVSLKVQVVPIKEK
jgi:large subunit ribosomal protein L9